MNIKSLITAGVVTLISMSAHAASTSGEGYTFTWDDDIGLVYDGTKFTKNYDVAGTLQPGPSRRETYDEFVINTNIQEGYYVETFFNIYFSVETTVYDGPSFTIGTLIFYQTNWDSSGGTGPYGDTFSFNYQTKPPAGTLPFTNNNTPINGDFVQTVAFGPFTPYRVNFSIGASGYTSNAVLNYEIQRIEYSIRVLPVPEPSTYAMLGFGLGLVGFAASRRRKTLN